MENIDPGQISMIAILLVICLDKVVGLLRSRGIDLHKITNQIDDLHKWHAVEDSEGVKIWYGFSMKRALIDALTSLASNIERETRLLEKIETRMEKIEEKLESFPKTRG